MKAYELQHSPSSELFIASDVIETAKELQHHLASLPPDNQPEQAAEAIEILGDPRELCGGKKVTIHTLGAFVLARDISSDSRLYHGTHFADAFVRGHFNGFSYVRHDRFRSLCIELFAAHIVASRSNPEFVGENIQSGTFMPVHSIESVLAA